MLFVEFRFLAFFLVVYAVYWWLRANGPRKKWLLACSYFFYGCWDWRFLFLIAFSTTVDFFVGRALESETDAARRRRWLWLSLAVNLGLLGTFKYCNFFLDSAQRFLTVLGLHPHLSTLGIVLPVGISFFTFQSLSYTIDVYRRHLRAVDDFFDLALAVSFFPQLVAGPITRAADFLPQLDRARRYAEVDVRACLVLFLSGYVKKACISEHVAPAVDQFFAAPESFGVLGAWLGIVFYSVQIYCDFSGYTDMALACAGLLGYRLAWNFDFPYFAPDIGQFWRRWHMSLSSWLRDYLYIPLGGNRGNRVFTARNLLLTMLLGGLWHGAAWHFVLWGGLHGVALIVQREWSARRGPVANPSGTRTAWTVLGTLATFYWVCLCWVFFRAPDLHAAFLALRPFVLFHATGAERLANDQFLAIAFGILALVHWMNYRRWFAGTWERLPEWAFPAAYAVAVGVVLLFVPQHYAPFIYFQF